MLGTTVVKDIQHPALEVGDDDVHSGKQLGRALGVSLNHGLMVISECSQVAIGGPTDGHDDAALSYACGGDFTQAEATDTACDLHVSPGKPQHHRADIDESFG